MTSWFALMFWVLVHSVWQAAVVYLVFHCARFLRPHRPSWSASAIASLAVFSIPVLSISTAVGLVSEALAAEPSLGETMGSGIALLSGVWALGATVCGAGLLVAMWRSLLGDSSSGTPRVVGWLRPSIVVPDAIAHRLPEDQLLGIIVHEQEHVRAGDAWINLLQCWLDVVYFFNPAYRWLSRAARQEREFRCDDAAANRVGTLVYLRALVEVAKGAAPPRACELNSAGDFERRVARLASAPASQGGRADLWVAWMATLLLIAVLPNAASVPVRYLPAAAWQARMVPVGQSVRNVVVPPLQAVGHALKKVAP